MTGPPPGWDPDQAAERIRARARHLAGILHQIQVEHPEWANPEHPERTPGALHAAAGEIARRQQEELQ